MDIYNNLHKTRDKVFYCLFLKDAKRIVRFCPKIFKGHPEIYEKNYPPGISHYYSDWTKFFANSLNRYTNINKTGIVIENWHPQVQTLISYIRQYHIPYLTSMRKKRQRLIKEGKNVKNTHK